MSRRLISPIVTSANDYILDSSGNYVILELEGSTGPQGSDTNESTDPTNRHKQRRPYPTPRILG